MESAAASEPDVAPAAGNRTTWAAICFAINFLYAVYLAGIGVVLEPMGRAFGFGAAVQGRLFPATFTGMVVSVLLCGFLSDRFGRRRVILTSIAVYSIALAIFAKAPTFGLALAAAPFIGAGSGAMQTVANALVADLFVARQKIMVNAAQIAFGCGAMCGPFMAARVLAAGSDWRGLYLGLSAVIACLFVVTLFAPSMPGATHRTVIDPAALKAILRQPVFLNLCLMAALYAGAEVGFFQWMPSYFHHRIAGGDRWAGLIVTIFWTGMTVGRIGSASLITRFPLARLRAVLSASGGLAALIALQFSAPAPTALFAALTGVCFGGIFSLLLAEAAQRYPKTTGTVFGIVVAISGIGTAIVPWAIGALAGTPLDWRGGLCLVPICAFTVTLITIWTGRPMCRE